MMYIRAEDTVLPMKLKKILIISGAVLVAAGVTTFTIVRAQSGYTKVLTAKVVRENLVSIVSGAGQIKPKTYVNVGATAFGRITHLYVKEGDHVKAGQLVATVESEQPASAVQAQSADVSIDGAAPGNDHGTDVAADGTGTVTEQRLYQLVRQTGDVRDHTFAIEFLDPGVQAYAFTFG